MEQAFVEHLTRYGPPVLFLAQMLGIVGLPIPDELLMTVAGALVRRGDMSGAATIAAAIAGSSSGITLSYLLGRTIGSAALHRLLHVPDAAFVRVAAGWRPVRLPDGGWAWLAPADSADGEQLG